MRFLKHRVGCIRKCHELIVFSAYFSKIKRSEVSVLGRAFRIFVYASVYLTITAKLLDRLSLFFGWIFFICWSSDVCIRCVINLYHLLKTTLTVVFFLTPVCGLNVIRIEKLTKIVSLPIIYLRIFVAYTFYLASYCHTISNPILKPYFYFDELGLSFTELLVWSKTYKSKHYERYLHYWVWSRFSWVSERSKRNPLAKG